MATLADFRAEKPNWCPGCGDFTVLAALQKAAANIGLEPEDMVTVSGVGCSGKISQYMGSYGFHSLHGRSIPVATAVKLSNTDLTVVAAGGDGDGYGIGIGHFIHALRRNIDITYIVMDNHIYGLTTGQTSPTSDKGTKTKTAPDGSTDEPVHPLQMAIMAGCGYVAQGYSGNLKQLTELIEGGMKHKGFSLINIYSPCVTFNKVNTYDFYKQTLVNVDEDPSYDKTDRFAAIKKIEECDEHLTGLLYHSTEKLPYHEANSNFPSTPVVKADINLDQENWGKLIAQFK
ncbi:2-oxoacid:ferredoxin oxidoreductase subunit beta [Tumebacillus sp. ITR2]|uniref:2-oxoacid:ferredoxin oxidoreductase subunit beta n=1 Tax=Tumebacillus amylolyticus TaxID=2801339 RepID=A0ABS1J7W6_9BACL|nr:2-oxoacid:ferredoxin oxidoreductase subunit beta [Tumebacillus amylolyticus]MBL0386372.1 2-oxoacid:ferredoxin oxidoreductase subunit beta [Tumebacillus amylolyticus]